jgi:DNA-directed RNA polymerase subunit M/transcription elongation factor TFIIS
MAIEFNCPECKAAMRVPDMHGGKKGHCPACRKAIQIPAASNAAPASVPAESSSEPVAVELAVTAPAAEAPKPAEATPGEAAGNSPYIKFNCPGCGKMTGFPTKFAGTPMTCPACKVKVMVPEKSGEESFIVGAVLAEEKSKPAKYKYSEPVRKPAPEKAAVAAQPPAPAAPGVAHAPKLKAAANRSSEKADKVPLPIILGGVFALGVVVTIAFLYSRHSSSAVAELERKALKPTTEEKRPAPVVTETPVRDDVTKQTPVTRPAVSEVPPRTPEPPKVVETPPDSVEIGVKTPATPENAPPVAPAKEPKSKGVDDDIDTEPAKRPDPPKQDPAFGGGPPVANQPQPNQPVPPPPAQADKSAKPLQPPIQNAPKPPLPKVAEGPCPQCSGTGFMPILPSRPYVQTGAFALNSNNAPSAVPWKFCSKCNAAGDPQSLITAETARLNAIAAANQQMEGATGLHLLYGETRYVAVRTTMPESETRATLAALDDLTAKLQQMTSSTVLTQTRPDTNDILIGWDDGGYKALLAAAGMQGTMGNGVVNENRGIYNANHGLGIPPKHMALYNFAYMLMQKACGNKSPVWLRLGFAAYAENLVTRKNCVYAFTYEKNDARFGDNWDLEIKRYAAQGRLKTWDQIFNIDGSAMKALDYLTIYSIVEYMMTTDPKLFTKLCLSFRDGMGSEQAIEKTYGRDYKQVQQLWAQWATTK